MENMHYNGMGVYTYNNQFDLDPIMLRYLGFSDEEIAVLSNIVASGGKTTVNYMVNCYGIPYEQAKKLKYMYDICTGKVIINSEDDLSKHLRKMFGRHQRIGIQNLSSRFIDEIPRTALIAGIPKDSPFAIWNSINYPPFERMYTVINATASNVTIETNRIPVLRYKQDKFIDGVLKIVDGPKDGILQVEINKEYCKLCNRFVIVASLRKPEFHHGMVEIICIEGTKVYVFADTISSKKYLRYGNNSQRVYDYGFFPTEIRSKLMASASKIYKSLCGVYANLIAANSDFVIYNRDDDGNDKDESIHIE